MIWLCINGIWKKSPRKQIGRGSAETEQHQGDQQSEKLGPVGSGQGVAADRKRWQHQRKDAKHDPATTTNLKRNQAAALRGYPIPEPESCQGTDLKRDEQERAPTMGEMQCIREVDDRHGLHQLKSTPAQQVHRHHAHKQTVGLEAAQLRDEGLMRRRRTLATGRRRRQPKRTGHTAERQDQARGQTDLQISRCTLMAQGSAEQKPEKAGQNRPCEAVGIEACAQLFILRQLRCQG